VKKLIINADDLGFSDEINKGIEECLLGGAVTGVSIMACGDCFREAVSMLRQMGRTEAGVHLTLTGKLAPATKDPEEIKSLVDKDKNFFNGFKDLASRYFLKGIREDELYRELSSQARKVLDEGFRVTHLDSHEHVHMFPRIFKVVLRIACELGIPYVRLPLEKTSVIFKQFAARDLFRHVSLKVFTAGRKKNILNLGLKSNDAFFGHFHAGRLNEEVFRYTLNKLNDGVNELAVHPCVGSEEFFKKYPWYRNGAVELEILKDPGFKRSVDSSGIQLITHKEAVEG